MPTATNGSGPSPERTLIPKPTDRADWLAARHPWFNASAAAVLFDRHPFQTPGDYATVKLTGDEAPPTRAMARGTRLEDVIAQWWADEKGWEVHEPDWLYTAGRMMATVDRVVNETGSPVEIKTTAHFAPMPEHYWLDQCQAIMACMGAPQLWLVWLDSSLDIQTALVTADPDHQASMLQRAERFMAAIDLRIVPDWVMLSASNVAQIYDKPKDMLDLDEDGLDLVRTYDMVRSVRLEAEKDEADVKDKLANMLRDKESAGWQGMEILTYNPVRVGQTFDTKAFRDEHPDLYDEYLIDKAPQRRFNLKLGGSP